MKEVNKIFKYSLLIFMLILTIPKLIFEYNIIPLFAFSLGYGYFGKKCVQLANTKKKNVNVAFFIGMFFNLLGYLVYLIYIKLSRGD